MDAKQHYKEIMDQNINKFVQSFLQNHPLHKGLQKKKQWMIRALWKVLKKTQKIVEIELQYQACDEKEYIQLQYDEHPSPHSSQDKQMLSKSSSSKGNIIEEKSSELMEIANLSDKYEQKIAIKYDQGHGNSFQIFKESDEHQNYKILLQQNEDQQNVNRNGIININQEIFLPKKHEKNKQKVLYKQNQYKEIPTKKDLLQTEKCQRQCRKKINNLKDLQSQNEEAEIKIQEDSQFCIFQQSNQKSQTVLHRITSSNNKIKQKSLNICHNPQNNIRTLQSHYTVLQKNRKKRQDQSELYFQSEQINRDNFQSKLQQNNFRISNKGRRPEYPQMQKRLSKWIRKQINEEVRVTQAEIRCKAIQIMKSCKMYDGKMFRASKGWMQKFFRRHSILFQLISKKNFKRLARHQQKIYKKIFLEDDQ